MRLSVAMAVTCLVATGLSAADQAKAAIRKSTNIEAQGLAPALRLVAQERGVQIVYRSELVGDRQTSGAVGELTLEEALTQLLSHTGLTYQRIDDDGITIVPVATAAASTESSSKRSLWDRFKVALASSSSSSSSQEISPSQGKDVRRSDEDRFTLEEIVVTAQKREERLIDVPLSITAISGSEIERRAASGLQDLQYSVPGLSLVGSGPGQQRIQLRGVTTTNGLPTIGQYLDEMPISIDDNTQSLDLRFIDLERVEVLRGPQGTLYGEGSMGGTIRYLTADPDLTRFGGNFESQAGSMTDGNTAWRANGVINLPVVKDRVGLRIVAGYEDTGGWIDNRVTGRNDVNAARIFTARGKLLAELTDNVQASLLYLHQDQQQDYQNYGVDRQSSSRQSEYNNPEYDLVNAIVSWNLGWASLIDSFGYQHAKNDTGTDLSSVYVPLLPLLGFPAGFITSVGLGSTSSIDVLTNELRLASTPGGAIDWTIGLYGRRLDRDGVSRTVTAPGTPSFDLISVSSRSESRAWAAFGELAWNVTDNLIVSSGLRYFHENRTLTALSANFGIPGINDNSGNFASVNPRFNISYKFSPDDIVYVSAAKGFRSGGFNSAATLGPLTYDPETLWTYELGTKHQFLDHRLTFDGAVYYNDWSDVQSSFFPVGAAIGYITNGGKVNGSGIDASLTAHPTNSLTLSATYGWNNLEYKSSSAEHAIGDPVDYAVQESWSGSIDYRRPVFKDLNGFARLDYQHAGRSSIINRGSGVNVAIDARDLLNARIGVDFGTFEASIFANNLTDERAPIIPGPFGVILQDVERTSRIVGVNLNAKF